MSDPTIIELVPHEVVTLLQIKKRTLDEPSANRIVDEVQNCASAEPDKPVVLDFAKVEFVPSAALGGLVRLAQGMRLGGTKLILVNVDRRVRGSFTVTRLDKVLDIRQTLEDAIYVLKGTL
ncbi:MAG: STAS domain-containing protein [Phycisphaerae bacterium]